MLGQQVPREWPGRKVLLGQLAQLEPQPLALPVWLAQLERPEPLRARKPPGQLALRLAFQQPVRQVRWQLGGLGTHRAAF